MPKDSRLASSLVVVKKALQFKSPMRDSEKMNIFA